MKACVISKENVSLKGVKLVDIAEPVTGQNEVLIKIKAASLNFRDYLIVTDNYSTAALEKDLILLSDAAGEVVAVGSEVDRFAVGDRVSGTFFQVWKEGPMRQLPPALGLPLQGVLTELVALNQDGVVKIPECLSYEEASCLPCAAVTAWNATHVAGKPIRPGDDVVCIGTGGVSMFTAQFAAAAGARVIMTSSSDQKLQRAYELLPGQNPADAINYVATPDWDDEVLRLTDGRGADQIMELGGAGTLARSYRALAFSGRVKLIGFRPDTQGDCNPWPLMMKDGHIDGVGVGSTRMFEDMNRAISVNRLKPPIEQVYAFDETVDALQRLASASFVGKLVISV
jgi:NADPH:quinone reductase-like Zn-dependent oxidoreductase